MEIKLFLSSLFSSDWGLAFQFGFVAFITFAIAKTKGYFYLPQQNSFNPQVPFFSVFNAFAIYLVSLYVINLLVTYFLKLYFPKLPLPLHQAWINFLCLAFITITLLIYLISTQKSLFKEIFKSAQSQSKIFQDIVMGLVTWLIAFPIVFLISHLLDLLIQNLTHVKDSPHQVAIDFLKNSSQSPLFFILALITVLVFAPLIEEILFRGLLQNWIKKYTGRKAAILLASLSFSVFHFSSSQGWSNITILLSLFFLSCFIGFIYERQKSLIAPIIMHATYNIVSVVNLFILKNG